MAGIEGKRMRQRLFSHWAIATLAVAALATGCASGGGSDTQSTGGGEFSEGPSGVGSMTDEVTTPELEPVYFDFDSAAIRGDQRPTLQNNVGAIGRHSEWRQVVVEGHCDERGSEEYNLALGERRANAVKQYLIDSGVSGGRIDTVSFGEASPAVQGHDESAWKWNRRAQFRVVK
jgi:peptidoglycan-associated lipoprotein